MEQLQKQEHYFKFEYDHPNQSLEQFTNENQNKDIQLLWTPNLEEIIKLDQEN